MKRIVEHIFVGIVEDILSEPLMIKAGWSILGCCKEPLHRKHAKLDGASKEGYVGRAMPKTESEYLWAERDHALYLNLIDARDMKYIPDEVIKKALDFIDKEIADNRSVLIVCNKAESRSPSIALMWLIKNGYYDGYIEKLGFSAVIQNFQAVYPQYNPSVGMRDYVNKFWRKYCDKEV